VAEAPSTLAIAARYVFAPTIFEALSRTKPGKNGEIQLTDAIRLLLQDGRKVMGMTLRGERRYDMEISIVLFARSSSSRSRRPPRRGAARVRGAVDP